MKDLARSRAFYVDTLGLQVTDEDKDAIYLRAMEERGHHCIVLRQSTESVARDLGFKVFSEEDLDKAEHFFKARGLPVEWVERPYQSRTFRPAIRMARRWNSIPGWTACRRSTSNMRFIGRQTAADRSFQLLLTGCRCLCRLLQRAWLSGDGIYGRRGKR